MTNQSNGIYRRNFPKGAATTAAVSIAPAGSPAAAESPVVRAKYADPLLTELTSISTRTNSWRCSRRTASSKVWASPRFGRAVQRVSGTSPRNSKERFTCHPPRVNWQKSCPSTAGRRRSLAHGRTVGGSNVRLLRVQRQDDDAVQPRRGRQGHRHRGVYHRL